jgi:fucose 4-O-acetylase-like acetyltransferase
MARLVLLPFMAFLLVYALVWALTRYRETQASWHEQSRHQPRCRPVLSRPIIMRGPR